MTSDVPQLVTTVVIVAVVLNVGATVLGQMGSSDADRPPEEVVFDSPEEEAAFERALERMTLALVGAVLSLFGGHFVHLTVARRARQRLEMVP